MNEQEVEILLKKKDRKIKRLEKEKEELQEKVCGLEKRLLMYENAHTPPSLQKKKTRIPRVLCNTFYYTICNTFYIKKYDKIYNTHFI
jgi:hypothetical protein